MCLLIARVAGSAWLPSDEEFNNAWASNPHGFGVSWRSDQLWINKTLDKEAARIMLSSIPAGAPFIMHWRLATHGSKSLQNCHPWSIFKGQWVGAHNGILNHQKCIGDMTDSQSFMLGLSGHEPNMLGIEKAIDRLGYGKMAFLSQSGELRIANERDGNWRIDNEVWESNAGMDSKPWLMSYASSYRSEWDSYSKPYVPSKSKNIDKRWEPLVCEWCNKHAGLYKVYNELCCASCVDEVVEVMQEVEERNGQS